MALAILIIWGIVSILLHGLGHISIADNYIGFTIILAAMYIEVVVKKRG